MSELLTEKDIDLNLSELSGWELSPNRTTILKEYLTKNFVEAVEFINKIKDRAEQNDHHPDIHLTGYRNLKVELSTHSLGGLTTKDFNLAKEIDSLPIELKK